VHVQMRERRTGLCHDVPPPQRCLVWARFAPHVTLLTLRGLRV
jgi:hypothetical protein